MDITRKNRLTAVAVIVSAAASLGVAFAQQQPITRPTSPQNQAVPYTNKNQTPNPTNPADWATPSLQNMGAGVDEGNIGPFATINDKQFARRTILRSMMEIRLSQAAAEKGSTPGVHQLGLRMVDDYSKWAATMTRAAARLNISIPSDLDGKRKSEVERIVALSGPGFDQAYLKEMVNLQNQALNISQFETDATRSGLTGFRRWADAIVPIIQDQLSAAKKELSSAPVLSQK